MLDEITEQLGDVRAFGIKVQVGDEQRGHVQSVMACARAEAARVSGMLRQRHFEPQSSVPDTLAQRTPVPTG